MTLVKQESSPWKQYLPWRCRAHSQVQVELPRRSSRGCTAFGSVTVPLIHAAVSLEWCVSVCTLLYFSCLLLLKSNMPAVLIASGRTRTSTSSLSQWSKRDTRLMLRTAVVQEVTLSALQQSQSYSCHHLFSPSFCLLFF